MFSIAGVQPADTQALVQPADAQALVQPADTQALDQPPDARALAKAYHVADMHGGTAAWAVQLPSITSRHQVAQGVVADAARRQRVHW